MTERPKEPARRLVEAGVVSIEEVDILIALSGSADQGCTAEQVTSAVRREHDVVQRHLVSLGGRGLVAADDGVPPRWRVSRSDLLPSIVQLAEAMPKRRSWVVNQFYSSRLDSLRAFSESFRLREDK